MDQEQMNKAIESALAAKLAEKADKPEQPRDLDLDAYEKLYIDNLLYRELAARRALELANRDLDDVAQMRKDIIKRISEKHKVKDGWAVTVDFQKKTAKAAPQK